MYNYSEIRLTRKRLRRNKTTVPSNYYVSGKFTAVDDENVCVATITTDKDILKFVQNSKIIIDADSDDEKENDAASVPMSSEMRNIMKSMHSYSNTHFNGKMNNKMVDIKQFVETLMC
ncbi:hypothetical protein TNCV_2652031 [Trichonephila clavipes]|nr:hypothetical protein TNCV_2652031 [Trichonephila clavipes]